MIDSKTRQKIRVSVDGTAGPYIMVPVDQLSHVRQNLDKHTIQYWVDSNAISLDGKPSVTVINFGRSEDPKKVQALLDNAA